MKADPRILKLCLMGEGGVGKTTLSNRILTGLFNPTTKMTIGIDFHLCRVEILNPLSEGDEKVKLEVQIWDFGGENRFRFLLPQFVKGATGGLLLYDLTRFSTQKYLNDWMDIWNNNSEPGAPLYLVGSKYDAIHKRQVEATNQQIKDLAESLGIEKYFLISSKTGYSIEAMLDSICKEMYIYNVKRQ
ncbi:MAG: Rab family GTPase [Promethearchaeota archaeon]